MANWAAASLACSAVRSVVVSRAGGAHASPDPRDRYPIHHRRLRHCYHFRHHQHHQHRDPLPATQRDHLPGSSQERCTQDRWSCFFQQQAQALPNSELASLTLHDGGVGCHERPSTLIASRADSPPTFATERNAKAPIAHYLISPMTRWIEAFETSCVDLDDGQRGVMLKRKIKET